MKLKSCSDLSLNYNIEEYNSGKPGLIVGFEGARDRFRHDDESKCVEIIR